MIVKRILVSISVMFAVAILAVAASVIVQYGFKDPDILESWNVEDAAWLKQADRVGRAGDKVYFYGDIDGQYVLKVLGSERSATFLAKEAEGTYEWSKTVSIGKQGLPKEPDQIFVLYRSGHIHRRCSLQSVCDMINR